MNKMSGAPVESGAVCTQLSCQDPQVKTEYFLLCINFILQSNLAGRIKNGDLTTFTAILADIAPQDDAAHLSLPDDEKQVLCILLFENK